ncbi:MAG: hypothetical protein Hens3KO_26250 [Henriciella sp.]
MHSDGPIDTANDDYRFFATLAERAPVNLDLALHLIIRAQSSHDAFRLAWKSAPNLHGWYIQSERYGVFWKVLENTPSKVAPMSKGTMAA